MRENENPRTVAIIGGGFSGAVVAARLAAQVAAGEVRIIVFEPREQLGRGLAYDTDNPSHRINVPADRMSLDPDNDQDFLNWVERHGAIREDPLALTDDGKVYPRRGVFGRYVSDFVAPFLHAGIIRHERDCVASVQRRDLSWHIETEGRSSFTADLLVIATSHPSPDAPQEFKQKLAHHPRFISDTTVPHALDPVGGEDRVLVVGTGLTAADVIASLDARGHKGPITFYSRRGLRSRGHARTAQQPFGNFADAPHATALGLLRQIRTELRLAQNEGLSWHAVFDALRNDAGKVWRNLPVVERRKLVRNLRPFWDVHRFRIAPQVEDVIDRRLKSGNLRLLAARAVDVKLVADEIWVTLQRRHTADTERSAYDSVIVTTGPAHGGIFSAQPWLAAMSREGLVELDRTGLGLACDDDSRATTEGGRATPGLFISGPLARGTFGELMGLPQVSNHATLVSNSLARELSLGQASAFTAAATAGQVFRE